MSNINLDSPVIQRLKDSQSEVSSALFSRALTLAGDEEIHLIRHSCGTWLFGIGGVVPAKGKTANEAVLKYLEAAQTGILIMMPASEDELTTQPEAEDTVDSTEGTGITVDVPADIIVDSPDQVVVAATKTGGMKKRNTKAGSR